MLYRTLGHTGEKVSAIGLGGWHLGLSHVDEALSIRIVRSAIDRGITFMDNSWDYNDGASEKRMGKALRDGYRDKVFLMTKIDGRSKKEAARQLDESLKRLQTDRIDLVQHHEVIRFDDPHRIFDPEGANAALLEARKAGQAPLHRLHRPQGSAHPSAHARGRARARLPLRRRADAAQRDGRALPQLRQAGSSRAGPAEHRRARHEEHGERHHPEVQDGDADRVPALRAEPADVGRDHRDATAWRSSTRRSRRRERFNR